MSENSSGPGPDDPRVHLAAERTLLAWIRTGIALMGFGFIVARLGLFLREAGALGGRALDAGHAPTPLWIGTSLVLLGVLVNVAATGRHRRLLRRWRADGTVQAGASPLAGLLGIVLALIGTAIAAYLVSLL